MLTSRKKPGVAFWATVVLSMPVVYAVSAVPMIYLHDSGMMPDAMQDAVKWFYAPLGQILWWIGIIRD
jgi:hypothetical protein